MTPADVKKRNVKQAYYAQQRAQRDSWEGNLQVAILGDNCAQPCDATLQYVAAVGRMHPPTAKRIDAAYRTAAKRCHPDKGGSEEMFKKLNALHEAEHEKL